MKKRSFLYWGKKLLFLPLSLLLLSVAVFCIARLAPGDPLMSYYGEGVEKMSPEEKEAAREKLGLNDSLPTQYVRWLQNAFRGDFGRSLKYKQPVTEAIGQRMGNTLLLGGIAYLLIFFGGLGVGLFCARWEGKLFDRLLCKIGTFLGCIPEFWMSLLLILVFAVLLRWLPSSGAYDPSYRYDIANRAEHLILPVTVVVLQHLWYYAYPVRNKLLEECRTDYVLLGKAKGLSPGRILGRHCLPNVLPSYLSLMVNAVPHILGGTYVVEMVFGYPGLGTLLYESARYHDYNLLMVLSLMTGAAVILSNFLGSLLTGWIDPRFHHSAEGREAEPV